MDKIPYNEGGNVVAAGISINIEGKYARRPSFSAIQPQTKRARHRISFNRRPKYLADNQMDSDTLAILLADT